MITLVILLCTSAAKLDCEERVLPLPRGDTIHDCYEIRRSILAAPETVGLPRDLYLSIRCK